MAEKPQHPPTIGLDGARLRPLCVADAAALYAYLRDPVVTELTSYPVASVPMVEAMIERSLSRWAAGDLYRWGLALELDVQLVGTCGFNEWSQVHLIHFLFRFGAALLRLQHATDHPLQARQGSFVRQWPPVRVG